MEEKYKKLTIKTPTEASNIPSIQKIYSPTAQYRANISPFYSPKARIPSKESASTSIGSESLKTESSIKNPSSLDQLNDKARIIF